MSSSQRPDPARARLAQLMDQRRRELIRQWGRKYSWDQVAARAGVHRETLRQIRNHGRDMQDTTKDGIEDALLWRRGSIDAIVAGGDPGPLSLDEDLQPNNGVAETGRLTKAERAREVILSAIDEDPDFAIIMAEMIEHQRARADPADRDDRRDDGPGETDKAL